MEHSLIPTSMEQCTLAFGDGGGGPPHPPSPRPPYKPENLIDLGSHEPQQARFLSVNLSNQLGLPGYNAGGGRPRIIDLKSLDPAVFSSDHDEWAGLTRKDRRIVGITALDAMATALYKLDCSIALQRIFFNPVTADEKFYNYGNLPVYNEFTFERYYPGPPHPEYINIKVHYMTPNGREEVAGSYRSFDGMDFRLRRVDCEKREYNMRDAENREAVLDWDFRLAREVLVRLQRMMIEDGGLEAAKAKNIFKALSTRSSAPEERRRRQSRE